MKKALIGILTVPFLMPSAAVAAELPPFSLALGAERPPTVLPGAISVPEDGSSFWPFLDVLPNGPNAGPGQGRPSRGLKAERRFSVILRGGLYRPGWNDLDGMIASYGALSEIVRGGLSPGIDFTSSWPAVNSVAVFGAEVLYLLTPRLAVGAGFELISKTPRGYYTASDYIHFVSDGEYHGEAAIFVSELGNLFGLTVETRLTVIPWTLQGYYFIPLGSTAPMTALSSRRN